MEKYKIRALTNADESILWTMLMYAAHESSVDSVRENPALDRYVKDWGRSGDFGFVAIDYNSDEYRMGAAWLRLFSSDERGFGYVDEGIPELAIAVVPEHRDRGIGSKLLMQVIEGARGIYPAISLSVRANNPVVNLYQRVGFVNVDGSEILHRTGVNSFNMIYRYRSII
jgi:ribosomal protein S18 acetylase RimI-like enzyme